MAFHKCLWLTYTPCKLLPTIAIRAITSLPCPTTGGTAQLVTSSGALGEGISALLQQPGSHTRSPVFVRCGELGYKLSQGCWIQKLFVVSVRGVYWHSKTEMIQHLLAWCEQDPKLDTHVDQVAAGSRYRCLRKHGPSVSNREGWVEGCSLVQLWISLYLQWLALVFATSSLMDLQSHHLKHIQTDGRVRTEAYKHGKVKRPQLAEFIDLKNGTGVMFSKEKKNFSPKLSTLVSELPWSW